MSAPKPPCCQKCQDVRQSCRTDAACCLECHFSYEEKYALPYLPAAAQHRLRREHKQLLAEGLPPHKIHEHAEREMEWFRTYCPPEIVAQIDFDHQEYGEGRLISRDAV
jgi:hypothetical protein